MYSSCARSQRWRFRLFSGLLGQVEATTVEVDRMHEVLPFRKPRAVYFTHWILALMDSLVALVIRWRRYVMMFSNRRLSRSEEHTSELQSLRPAQLCHQRKCFLAGRS